jgi:type IV secretory pathway VirB10-like protein
MSDESKPAPETESGAQQRGTLENKTSKPAGLLPRNTQQVVILGVAVVMVLIMWLTGGTKRTTTRSPSAAEAALVRPPNPATVEDFKQTIQKEQAATRQPISPADLALLRSMGLAGDVPAGNAVTGPYGTAPEPGGVAGIARAQEPPDSVKEDKKKREYLSLFAPNLAFTHRKGQDDDGLSGSQPRPAHSLDQQNGEAAPSPSSALDTQLDQTEAQFAAAGHEAAQSFASRAAIPAEHETRHPSEVEPPNPDTSSPGAFNSSVGRRYVVFEGSIIETLLINRLNGTFAGPVDCLVTNDIYSRDGQHSLVPSGTKVLGETKKVEAVGQQRLAMVFHRLIMPDGFSVNLDQFKGLNQVGETALRDKVNNHYLQIFGASLAVGILGGIAQAGTGNVLNNSGLDQARAGFGSSLAVSSEHILDRFLNILPTVTIREGSRVKIYLSDDLLLPDYAQHTIRPDI